VKSYRRLAGVVVIGCCVLMPVGSAQTGDAGRRRVAGAWRLESRTVRAANGDVVPDAVLGKEPIGRLFYDASGHMMLQMMRRDREQAISVRTNPAEAKNARVVLGYDAYFGTFRVNDRDGTITHHVEGSLFPEDLGKDFTRGLTVEGDRLMLKFTSKAADGPELTRTLVFRREPR